MRPHTLSILDDAIANMQYAAQLIDEDISSSMSGPIEGLITEFDQLRKCNEAIKAARKSLDALEDRVSHTDIPDAFKNGRIKPPLKVEGVGTVTIARRWSCSIIGDDKLLGHEWLRSNGHGGLITETVNSSTLAGFAKNMVGIEGKDLPDHIFRVSINPYTSIIGKAKI